jgi:Flp pilus assembly protein TadG
MLNRHISGGRDFGQARALKRDGRSGVAMLEFAVIAPMLVILLVGMTNLGVAYVDAQRIGAVADEAGLMATQLAIQPDQTTTLTAAQVYAASSIIYAIMPETLTMPSTSYGVTISDIYYAGTGCYTTYPANQLPCSSYTANVAWSVPMAGGLQWVRPCGVVTQTGSGTAQVLANGNGTPTTIPTAGLQMLTSVIVVDVTYKFTPFFTTPLLPGLGGIASGGFSVLPNGLTLQQTFFAPQRTIVSPYIAYTPSSSSYVCSGYT